MQKQWDIFQRTMGYDYRLFSGIYSPKVWDILGKNYGIYYGIYWLKIGGYILQNYGIYWSFGYIKQKLRNVLGNIWDIES